MEDIKDRVKEKQEEIDALKLESESMQELLEEEIQDKESKIQEVREHIENVQSSLNALKSEYNRSEAQIVSLQYSIETAKNILKSHVHRKNELEILNDKWETSIRSLEYYNNQLEEQIDEAEHYVLTLHCKIQNTSSQTIEDLSLLSAKNEEMKKIIKNKSRSPSPVQMTRPPVSPKMQIQLAKQETISIINKPLVDDAAKVVVVSPDSQFWTDRVLQVKEKGIKKSFEFNRIIRRSAFSDEVKEIIKNLNNGKNVCIMLNSHKTREGYLGVVVQNFCDHFIGKTVEVNCVEILKDKEVSLFKEEWKKLEVGKDLESELTSSFSKLSKGRNHIVVSIKIESLYLQLLDIGEVNEDQELSESLSLNASMFYLEELLMNLKKDKPKFEKSSLTRKLQLSISSNYFLVFLMQFDGINDLPGLSLAARLEAVFSRSFCENEQNHRTLDLLERERLANFKILRLIEKAQKDLALMKNEAKNKDLIIESLLKKKLNTFSSSIYDRRFSESPKLSPLYQKPSKIPLPKPKRIVKK